MQLWSATLPVSLELLCRSAVNQPLTISVGMGLDGEGAAAASITQRVVVVDDGKRLVRVLVARAACFDHFSLVVRCRRSY